MDADCLFPWRNVDAAAAKRRNFRLLLQTKSNFPSRPIKRLARQEVQLSCFLLASWNSDQIILFDLFRVLSGKTCSSICSEKTTENSIQMVNVPSNWYFSSCYVYKDSLRMGLSSVTTAFGSRICFPMQWLPGMSPSLEQTSPSKERSEYFRTSTMIRLRRPYLGAYSLCCSSSHYVMKLYIEITPSCGWWCDRTMACMLWAIEVEGRLSPHVRQRETFWRVVWTVFTSNVSISGRPCYRYSNQKWPSNGREKIR